MRHMLTPSIELVIKKEGGYSKAPLSDPGGETCFGIARNRHPDWQGWKIVDDLKVTGLISSERVWERCEGLIRKFYKEEFWDKLECNALPAGIDTMVFDIGVNQGKHTSAKCLQYACGASQDGIIGPNTLTSVKSSIPLVLLDKLLRRRLYYYGIVKDEENRKTNIQGWVNRALDIFSLCLEEVS